MKTFKIFAFIIFIFGASASFGQNKVIHPIKPKDFNGLGLTGDIKILAQGSYSKVEKPFVFIARDDKTYAQLQNLVEGLPAASTIDFKQNAVIAGFAGERSTGGWTVEMKKTSAGKIGVVIQKPGKDMMVTQAITTAYKVVSVPIEADKGVALNLAPDFINRMQNFLVNKSDFEFSGGIAGRRKQFKVGGTVRLLTFGDSASVWFDLKGKGAENKRFLLELGSGTFKSGNLDITRMDSGSLIDFPRPSFKVSGTLKGNVLSLKFESVETNYADGFEGKGSLEAIRIK